MQLLTTTLEERFAMIGSQDEVDDPLVIAKFFNPNGAGTWLATEYDPESRTFFGYVSIFGDWNDEWGSFALDELEAYRGPLGLGIERDLYWREQPFSAAKRALYGPTQQP
jgi:hypothetical protein